MDPVPFPYAAVLFDVDGVIIDTTELHYAVWDAFARRHGHAPTADELLATNGRRAGETIRQWLGDALDDAAVASLTADREMLFHQRLVTDPVTAVRGVTTFVNRLEAAGVATAVVTSAIPANAELALARVGLAGRFGVVVTAADVTHGKPHPEPYLTAAARLGVAADRCLVVEDSIPGLQAGQAAGAACLALTTTVPRASLEAVRPTWIADDFTTLPAALAFGTPA